MGGMTLSLSLKVKARVSMVPLDQAKFSAKDKGVRDGIADCGACSRGQ